MKANADAVIETFGKNEKDMTEVQLSIPDEIVQTLHLKIPLETEIIESFAISLYEQGRISSGEAALLTGLNRKDWEIYFVLVT